MFRRGQKTKGKGLYIKPGTNKNGGECSGALL